MADEILYNDPVGGTDSAMGTQIRTDYFNKKALVEAAKEQYFGQLADVTAMPKNMGKKIKRYHYLPLLDDANVNDQGIDAAGLSVANELTITIVDPDGLIRYAVGNGIDAAAALTAAEASAMEIYADAGLDTTNILYDTYAEATAYLVGLAAPWVITAGTAVPGSGNLYGSSKDVGYISSKMPALSETGGRVNRVGFKRIEIEGTIEKFGFFDEYSQESMDFDSDAELEMHITRESVLGANEITEDALQIDLLNGASTMRYAGVAITAAEITGEAAAAADDSVISYEDLMRLSIDLDNNRTPKHTKVITGSRMIDTNTISAGRVLYIGSELIPSIKRMTDLFGNKAFIEVQHYASSGTTLRGEIGSVDQFRIVVVPEMMHWEGAGAAETVTNRGYRATGGNYDVFPALVVGSGSFTTIGFQTDGKTVKFKIKHVKPGSDVSYSKDDPYGEMGFYSIKWYYGSMMLRPERIGLIKCVAEV